MKVLILGAKGMLGQELVKTYEDHDVVAWDREECDVLDADACDAKIREMAPDVLLNAIGYNAVDLAEGDGKDMANRINGEVPGRLAQLANDLDIPFVHYGTEYVVDGENEKGYAEDAVMNPLSVYGRSKLDGENAVAAVGGKGYVIRLSRLFGKPATSDAGKKSFIDVMLGLAQTKDHLDLVDEEESSPTYAPDLAKRTREIVEAHPPGLYHAANSGSCTWYGFAKEIFKQKGVTIDITPVSGKMFPRPAKRPMHCVLLNTKLPRMRLWTEALEEYLKTI
ncbi:dTDP-4-dehydrorhamnose reductase [Candidatus Uhrbacteria bacterium]|nr:dTDP-4-dehydrorhamnose reductase [Candidatus Uhrbacteria bacterium]